MWSGSPSLAGSCILPWLLFLFLFVFIRLNSLIPADVAVRFSLLGVPRRSFRSLLPSCASPPLLSLPLSTLHFFLFLSLNSPFLVSEVISPQNFLRLHVVPRRCHGSAAPRRRHPSIPLLSVFSTNLVVACACREGGVARETRSSVFPTHLIGSCEPNQRAPVVVSVTMVLFPVQRTLSKFQITSYVRVLMYMYIQF